MKIANNSDTASLSKALSQFKEKEVSLTFYLRSVEGMIYYLGEVVRRQLAPEFEDKRSIFVKFDSAYVDYPWEECVGVSRRCVHLFVLIEGIGGASEFLSVEYAGRRFSVPESDGLVHGGLTSLVLDILRQQIALNSSAKSQPQSSVISVVGGGQ